MICSGFCAPCASGPAMIRTAPLLGTGTPDQGVLHPCALGVGVGASHVPVYRAGLSSRPWSGSPMWLWAGAYATLLGASASGVESNMDGVPVE